MYSTRYGQVIVQRSIIFQIAENVPLFHDEVTQRCFKFIVHSIQRYAFVAGITE